MRQTFTLATLKSAVFAVVAVSGLGVTGLLAG